MTSRSTCRRPRLHHLAAALLAATALQAATAQTTTLGTRGSTAQANLAITSNAGATWTNYSRAETYPNAITLPLKFITLSSGKKMAVFVSVPANIWGQQASGKFPVILTQTGYRIDMGQLLGTVAPQNETLIIGGLDKYMVKRGYINVAVDVFGTGMTGGVTKLIGEEEQQGYREAVAWVTQQPWFNGNLGLAGTSYLGITSLLTAEQQNPAVKAVFAEVPMGDAYRGVAVTGGMLNGLFLSTWMTLTQNLSAANLQAALLHPLNYATIMSANADHVAAINGWYLPTINAGLAGGVGIATDDATFWAVRSPIENANKIQVPTFIIGSSHDIFQRDEPLLYEQMKNRVNTKLVIVPGAHVQAVTGAMSNNNNATSHGAPDSESLMLQWFDQYLMGKDTGASSLPNVTQFVDGYGASGVNRYATSTDWPHPAMAPQRMYLHGDGSLSSQAPTGNETSHTVSEPKGAAITTGTLLGSFMTASVTLNDGSDCSVSKLQWTLGIAGVTSNQSCFAEDDTVNKAQGAVIYETPALASDLYLNGPVQADIWMAASKTQAALSVRVDDVDPSGVSKPLTNGLMSATYRAVDTSRSRYVNGTMIQPWHAFTLASAQPVVPGQPMLVPVEVFPTAALVRAGHKLRIAISASNQAQGFWPSDKQAEVNGNVSTILNDADHPSSIVLPVVPTSALN